VTIFPGILVRKIYNFFSTSFGLLSPTPCLFPSEKSCVISCTIAYILLTH